jgi:hypothetical protein
MVIGKLSSKKLQALPTVQPQLCRLHLFTMLLLNLSATQARADQPQQPRLFAVEVVVMVYSDDEPADVVAKLTRLPTADALQQHPSATARLDVHRVALLAVGRPWLLPEPPAVVA